MNLIGFSHHYTKMHGQTHGKLIYVDIVQIKPEDEGSEWWEYDTEYRATFATLQHDDSMLLKHDEYVRLVFLGNKGIPFTTYRERKDDYCTKKPVYMFSDGTLSSVRIVPYSNLIGEEFVFKFRGKPIPMGLKPPDGKYDVMIYD